MEYNPPQANKIQTQESSEHNICNNCPNYPKFPKITTTCCYWLKIRRRRWWNCWCFTPTWQLCWWNRVSYIVHWYQLFNWYIGEFTRWSVMAETSWSAWNGRWWRLWHGQKQMLKTSQVPVNRNEIVKLFGWEFQLFTHSTKQHCSALSVKG